MTILVGTVDIFHGTWRSLNQGAIEIKLLAGIFRIPGFETVAFLIGSGQFYEPVCIFELWNKFKICFVSGFLL